MYEGNQKTLGLLHGCPGNSARRGAPRRATRL